MLPSNDWIDTAGVSCYQYKAVVVNQSIEQFMHFEVGTKVIIHYILKDNKVISILVLNPKTGVQMIFDSVFSSIEEINKTFLNINIRLAKKLYE